MEISAFTKDTVLLLKLTDGELKSLKFQTKEFRWGLQK